MLRIAGPKENRDQQYHGLQAEAHEAICWDGQMDWKQQVQMREEQRQKRGNKKERVVGKKETFEVGKKVKLQDIK